MARRRRHWGRIVLGHACLFLVMLYSGMMISVLILKNDGLFDRHDADLMRDMTPPVIEMRGGEVLTFAVGDTLDDPGVEVYDDSSIPVVEVESDVNVREEGEYHIWYNASDESGNTATRERIVKIIQPTGRIYLTFDDGPSEYTAALLDVLNKYGVKVTFFVTGYGDDALIKREFDEGHTVGLHTMSHDYSYVYANLDNYWADLSAIQDKVQRITGEVSNVIRFPGGSSNLISAVYDNDKKIMSTLVKQVVERGLKYFDWNIDSDDAGGANSADEVFNNVIKALHEYGEFVVLQHDVKPYSVEAVERIIQYGLEHGYVFSRIRENSFDAHHGVNN